MNKMKPVIILMMITMMIGVTYADEGNASDNDTLMMGTLTVAGVMAQSNVDGHYGVTEYDNATSCDVCHKGPSKDFATSVHNTWSDGERGKMNGINDFCGTIGSNEGMCGKCHGGFGLPTADFSPEQTDCLICHAPNYKKTATGPDPSNDYSEIMPGIGAPEREYCLRCHANAGGGNNRKRGDLELAMGAEVISPDLDVHMAAGMVCQDCHEFDDKHHVAGQGMDLRVADSDKIVTCDGCHNVAEKPHKTSMYNEHMDKIACTTCHVVEYGKVEPAETARNWEKAFIPGMLTKEQNAKPEYAWWDRTQTVMDLGDPAVIGPDGTVSVASPGGAIDNPYSKIYAVRNHRARQPWDGEKLLGYNVPTVKASSNGAAGIPGDMALGISVTQGIPVEDVEFSWVDTSRTLGLFHGVAPAEDALRCDDCHYDNALDFEALGYEVVKDGYGNVIDAHKVDSSWNLVAIVAEGKEGGSSSHRIIGDVTGDGKVNIGDGVLLFNWISYPNERGTTYILK